MGAYGIKLDKEASLSRKAERGAQRLGIGTGSPIILMGLHIVEALKLPANTDVEVPPVFGGPVKEATNVAKLPPIAGCSATKACKSRYRPAVAALEAISGYIPNR